MSNTTVSLKQVKFGVSSSNSEQEKADFH